MIGNKNSTDLDVGRRPKLKSDEFLLPIIVVIELTSLLCLKPPKKCCSYWRRDPINYSMIVEIREFVS